MLMCTKYAVYLSELKNFFTFEISRQNIYTDQA